MQRLAFAFFLTLAVLGTPAAADPVADFYKGKQIKMIIRSGVGGGYDLYARVLGAHIGKHIPGNPQVVVLVGQLTLHDWKAPLRRFRVNRMVNRLNTPESPVVAVNHFEGWVEDPKREEADTYDGIHPNRRGQSRMALAWFAALRPYLKGLSAPV